MKALKKNSNIKVVGKVRMPKPKIPKKRTVTINPTQIKQASKSAKKHKKYARAGEVWIINNKSVRGHPSLLTKRKYDNIEFIVTTHSPYTAHKRNIKLRENFDKNDNRDSYIIKKVQQGQVSELGTYKPNLYPRNNVDKSIIRAIKNKKK